MIRLLAQVVDLGDDVAGALVVDPLDALVVVHQHAAGGAGELGREREVGRRTRGRGGCGGGGVDGHGDGALRDASCFGHGPEPVTVASNVSVAPGCDPRATGRSRLAPPRSSGRVIRHVVEPEARALVRDHQRDAERRRRRAGTRRPAAGNGPIPRTASSADQHSATTASPIPRKTVPWTCELAASRSPSGLQRSHSPTSSGTGAPQRAQAWVRPVGAAERRGHQEGNPATYQRSAAATSASTSWVVRARTIAPSAPASRQRSQDSRGARHHGLSAMSASPSQSPWNPT